MCDFCYSFWVGSLMSRDKFFETIILPSAGMKEFLLKLPMWTYQWLLPQTNPSLLQLNINGLFFVDRNSKLITNN